MLSPTRLCAPRSPRQRRASWGGCNGMPRDVVIATWTPHHTQCPPGTAAISRNSAQNGPRRSRTADSTKGQLGQQPRTLFSLHLSCCPRPTPLSALQESHRRPGFQARPVPAQLPAPSAEPFPRVVAAKEQEDSLSHRGGGSARPRSWMRPASHTPAQTQRLLVGVGVGTGLGGIVAPICFGTAHLVTI